MTILPLPDGVVEAHDATMTELLNSGDRTGTENERFGPASEFLSYQTGMADPLKRLVAVNGVTKNVVPSVARFIWLVAGSDRLEDIAYYEPRAKDFTDDQLTMPGSSYGRRLFNARPGLNQIEGVVANLEKDPGSRRAAAVVWLPEDAARQSNDIPCTFGLFFHIRDGALRMTTVMRSNNAFTLLPYNFFEFSMVGEMVAASVGVPFGTYRHWAASMHIFDKDSDRISGLLNEPRESLGMPGMPRDAPLDAAHNVAVLEARLRNASTLGEIGAITSEAEKQLDDYWLAFFRVLLVFGLHKRGHLDEARTEGEKLPDYFRGGLVKYMAGAPMPESDDAALFGDLEDARSRLSPAAAVAAATAHDDDLVIHAAELITEAARQDDTTATTEELLEVVRVLRRGDLRLAARSGAGKGHPDFEATDDETIVEVYRDIRSRRG